MSTQHKLIGERVNNPSKQQIRRIAGNAFTTSDFKMKPGYLYTVVRAISARVNQNYDGWPSDELKKSYKSFVGKPVFVNHENYHPDKARGVVVASRYVENGNDKYIEVIQEIDAKRFPKLAHEIRTGGLDSVSMGAEAGFTICSFCGNKAYDVPDMCEHVLFHKGEKLSRFNRKTGQREKVLVYESCHKLSFFELSYVFDPADETAVASKVLVAARHTAADCPPGADCTHHDPSEQISADSPNNPLNQQGGGSTSGSTSGGGVGTAIGGGELGKPGDVSGGGGSPQAGDAKYMPQTKPLYDDLMKTFPGADIGTYRVDDYHEHDHGAMDFMTSDPNQATQVRQKAFDSGAPYVLWQQKQWNPDGSTTPMEDRGSPTDNHMDHVHIGPIPGKSASFEQRVLTAAGFKSGGRTADKCHYCAGDAEEGFSSCEGHRKMEENKFKAAVLREAGFLQDFLHPPTPPNRYPPVEGEHPGAGQSWSYDPTSDSYSHPSGHELHPSDEELYRGMHQLWTPTVTMSGGSGELAKDRRPSPDLQGHFDHVQRSGSFETKVLQYLSAGNPFTDSSGRYQGPTKTKTSYPPSPYGDGDTCPECGQHFTQGHAPGCSKASKWGNKMSFEARVLEAAGMHRMPDHPGRHEAPPGRDPHIPPEGYQVYDAKDWLSLPQPVEASFQARVIKAWGETEAPASVDTLREEGSAPEDDNNDFYHYVEPPKELQAPDLSEAAQIDREQDTMGQDTDGQPGPASPDAGLGGPPQAEAQQYMELKIPIPQPGQAGAANAPGIPMQPYQDQPPQPPAPAPPGPPGPPPGPPQQQIAAATLLYFDRYFGHRVGRINLQTLENGHAGFTKSRNPMKGTANMARSTLAERGKVVTAGRRQHFADGPLVDSGDQSRNDQGEQEEVFITQTPPAEAPVTPKDGEEISNTENNLVAKVRKGRDQLLRDAQALASFRRKTAGDQDEAGGPVATEVNPTVNTGPAGEELTGDDFESADPNADVQETQPKDASLHAFKQFDHWLASKTGKPSRLHTSATIRRAADDYSRAAGISVQAMFPALGIVLGEVRKNEKPNTKGANMRKRADEKLEVAAPDGRIDVEAPTEGTTDADAQASQFDLHDFGNNAGDNLADPDLSTDQNWAPGEANKTSKVKTAGGILAFRCAEAMIAAGLEPNSVERKYALASQFENMNRGLVQDRTALCERFAAVLQDVRRQVASGSTRGANLKPPVPSGLTQGTGRTASVQRVAANDPRNDSTLFI